MHEKFVPQDMRPLHKKLVDQFHLMKTSLGIQVGGLALVCSDVALASEAFNRVHFPPTLQEFPGYVRASPVHFTNGSPRTCRNSVPSIISPEGGRGVTRRR